MVSPRYVTPSVSGTAERLVWRDSLYTFRRIGTDVHLDLDYMPDRWSWV